MIELGLSDYRPPKAAVSSTTVSWDQYDERWFSDGLGMGLGESVIVGPRTMFLCDVVLGAIRFIADAFAVCPPQVFRKTMNDGREAQSFHRVQRTLRNPNAWQTGFEWRQLQQVHLNTYGNSYNRIFDNGSTPAELWPIDPWRIKVEDQLSDGRLVYSYRPKVGAPERLTQDSVLHFKNLSFDGFSGMETWALIRNAVSIALAVQRHELTFMKKGLRVAGVLVPDGPPADGQAAKVKQSWDQAYGGSEQTGSVAVLPYGFKFQPLASDNEKGQVIELGNAQVESILRSLGVPGVVVGYQGDKSSTYASADAFFEKGGIKHCIFPRVVSFEQREEKELLNEAEADYFIKHNLDVLTRPSTKDTFDILVKARGGPIMSLNEARRIIDLNPDPDGDEVLKPSNMTGDQGQPEPVPAPEPPAVPRRRAMEFLPEPSAAQFISDAAARVVRRELTAIKDRAPQAGRDPAAWKEWVRAYYGRHAAHVADVMHIEEAAAEEYAAAQRDALLERGLIAAQDWDGEAAGRLVALAQTRSSLSAVEA